MPQRDPLRDAIADFLADAAKLVVLAAALPLVMIALAGAAEAIKVLP